MNDSILKLVLGGAIACGLALPVTTAQAHQDSIQVLANLQGSFQNPWAGLVEDASGNLYGTTYNGGSGYGNVFMLATDGTLTDLHDFAGGGDGGYPRGDLVFDASGNLYGTTYGNNSNDGTVFEIAADGTYSVLYGFAGGSDGAHPAAGLLVDQAGDLYGTTYYGGNSNNGTVFEVASDGTESVLHQFGGRP
ncbi:MAG TPA: choice-of-anchor tandem repeat GloVer-containing protein, partial [Rhizomicrobium sp.]|nr:choice-of-anchor tandem repeat GloVer-containing protein [Rhizomicrobium sp.]